MLGHWHRNENGVHQDCKVEEITEKSTKYFDFVYMRTLRSSSKTSACT